MGSNLKGNQKKIDVNKDGKIDEKDFKILNRDRTRGADAAFSREVEEGNKRRARETSERIKREMKDADGYKCGGSVKRKYADGGMVCRGGGSAVGGTKFRGVR